MVVRRQKTYKNPDQEVMFAPDSGWTPPNLNDLPSWKDAKRIGLDCETKDSHLKQTGIGVRRGGKIVGVSFCIEDDRPYYLPIQHARGGNLDPERVVAYLKDNAKLFTGDIVGANLQYDLDYLLENEVEFPQVRYFRDVQIADPLINELHFRYSLEAIAGRWNLAGKDETLLREAAAVFSADPKTDLWRLHSSHVGPYAEQDAALPLQILRKQERVIDDEDLWEIYNLESKVLPVLVRMRRRGVLIDQDRMEAAEKWTIAEEKKALDEVHRLTGVQVGVGNVWDATRMAMPLHQLGMTLQTDKHSNPMVNAPLLEGMEHPVGQLLLRARRVNKARTTFIESIKRYMTNGRIHATFNQLKREKDGYDGDTQGAAYGRLSCADPNLQQQPSPGRDPEIGALIRGLYIPDPGGVWASNDYSQQEPRWLTHYAELCNLPKAFEAAERYRSDPNTDNHQMMADMAGIPRKPAKTIYLGLCYGMGGKKLSINLGLPTRWKVIERPPGKRWVTTFHEDYSDALAAVKNGDVWEVAGEEAQGLLDAFNNNAPYVKKLAQMCNDQAKKHGFIKTAGGRKCHFPFNESAQQYDFTHKGLNRLIQGSSGDQMKAAMVAADEEGFPLQLQVHDELGGTHDTEESAHKLAEVMKHALPCNVPHVIDVEFGDNWGEAG